MISHLLRRTVMAAMAASLAASLPAQADDNGPVDAVPLVRPSGMPPRAATMPDDQPAAPDTSDTPLSATTADDFKLGATPLPAPEAALERIPFDIDEVTLGDAAETRLKSFADRFKSQSGRVMLRAYAGAIGDVTMNARRTSLKRALAVREFLLAQGIDAERLDVQALGGAHDAGPRDRVDIIQAGRQSVGKKPRS